MAPLLPTGHASSRLKQEPIQALALAHYLSVHVSQVTKLARRMHAIRLKRAPNSHMRYQFITWPAVEKIMIIIRARQGAEEINRIAKRAHFTPPSSPRR